MSTAKTPAKAARKPRKAPSKPRGLAAAVQAASAAATPAPEVLDATNAVDLADDTPIVLLTWGDRRGQLTPDKAAQLGLRLLQASVRADMEAAAVRVLRQEGEDRPEGDRQAQLLLQMLQEAVQGLHQPATQA